MKRTRWRSFVDIPGLTVEAQPRVANYRPDAVLHFADREETVFVEIKRHANAATAWQLAHYALDAGTHDQGHVSPSVL